MQAVYELPNPWQDLLAVFPSGGSGGTAPLDPPLQVREVAFGQGLGTLGTVSNSFCLPKLGEPCPAASWPVRHLRQQSSGIQGLLKLVEPGNDIVKQVPKSPVAANFRS